MIGEPQRLMGWEEEMFPTVEAFESGKLDPEAFDHAAHVYIAWKLLEKQAPAAATMRFIAALKRLTAALGIESKYHETISCFYMALIAERRSGQPAQSWADFADSNPDLLGPPPKLLDRYYSGDRLWSDLARCQFLLPDMNLPAGNDSAI